MDDLTTDPTRQLTLLEELDQRQNDLLGQLDELNRQVEQLLEQCTQRKSNALRNEGASNAGTVPVVAEMGGASAGVAATS